MEQSKKRQDIISAAKLYYYGNMSQDEIAQLMNISRPKVSRLLSEARQLNIVQIVIHDPSGTNVQNAERIKKHFGLKYVKIVPTQNTEAGTKSAIGQAASDFLNETLHETSKIGISWGTTLASFAHHYEALRAFPKATVVQLVGGTYSQSLNIDGRELVKSLSKKLACCHSILQAPFVVHNPKLRDMLMEEPDTKRHFALVNSLDLAFVGIGTAYYKESIIYRANFIEQTVGEDLAKLGAVCDICGHQIMSDGSAPNTYLTDRIVGIDLVGLHRIPLVVGLCEGKKKAAPLLAALRGRHINCLIIDEVVALNLLAEAGL